MGANKKKYVTDVHHELYNMMPCSYERIYSYVINNQNDDWENDWVLLNFTIYDIQNRNGKSV